jgi:hypothetical protein
LNFFNLWQLLESLILYGFYALVNLNKMNISFTSEVNDLPNKLFVNGEDKEIKFIEIHEEKKIVKIFFKDFTYVTFDDVKILKKEG